MKTVEFYAVSVIADCEGRTTKVLARFDSELDASIFATSPAGRDMYNCAGTVQHVVIDIAESTDEATKRHEDAVRKSAMAKLTREEREALGL